MLATDPANHRDSAPDGKNDAIRSKHRVTIFQIRQQPAKPSEADQSAQAKSGGDMAPKRSPRRLLFVRWLDASFQASECTDDELNPDIIVESAGILAREDDDSISMALDSYAQQGIWRRIQHIPKPYIREIRRVTV